MECLQIPPPFSALLPVSGPEQAPVPGRGDYPLCIPDIHNGVVHRLPLLTGPGHAHGSHGGHRCGCTEWNPHQGGKPLEMAHKVGAMPQVLYLLYCLKVAV